MTDAERLDLNKAVAEWLGFDVLGPCGDAVLVPRLHGEGQPLQPEAIDFTRDWNAMAMIVERLHELGWVVAMQQPTSDCNSLCSIRPFGGSDLLVFSIGRAPTLPEAVAMAALKVPNKKETHCPECNEPLVNVGKGSPYAVCAKGHGKAYPKVPVVSARTNRTCSFSCIRRCPSLGIQR